MPSDLPDFEVHGECASCGRHTLGQHQQSCGPFHCSACWGDADSNVDAPAAMCGWWEVEAHAAWIGRARDALPRHQTSFADETFEVVTDKPPSTFFTGVGAAKVWPAVQRIMAYLNDVIRSAQHRRDSVHPRPPRRPVVVELGCGCGVPGMLLARHGFDVVLTDLPWLLPLTHLNVSANEWNASSEARRPAPRLP